MDPVAPWDQTLESIRPGERVHPPMGLPSTPAFSIEIPWLPRLTSDEYHFECKRGAHPVVAEDAATCPFVQAALQPVLNQAVRPAGDGVVAAPYRGLVGIGQTVLLARDGPVVHRVGE